MTWFRNALLAASLCLAASFCLGGQGHAETDTVRIAMPHGLGYLPT